MQRDEPDFEITKAAISGEHQHPDIFNRWMKTRWRVVPFVALIVFLLVALLFTQRGQIVAFIATYQPTPTPTVASTPLPKFVIGTNVSGGTLTVNGKAVPFTAYDPTHALILTKQRTIITLHSPPFQTLTCTFDGTTFVDQSNQGRCGNHGRIAIPNTSNTSVPIIDMNLTLADLPALPSQQFAAFIQTKLASLNTVQAVVPAGEHYATGVDSAGLPIVDVARTALHAQSWVIQPTSPTFFDLSDCSRDGICASYGPPPTSIKEHLFATFTAQLSVGWRFFDSTGQQVASFMPHDNDPALAGPRLFLNQFLNVNLTYDTTTGWHELANDVIGLSTNQYWSATNLCSAGSSLMEYLLQQQVGNNTGLFTLPAIIDGCLFVISTTGASSRPDPAINPVTDTNRAWFLSHFGTLLAVNDKAHILFSQLPRATTREATEIWKASPQP